MKDPEYMLLKKMLDKNRRMFKKGDLEFSEYLENHLLIMKKLKGTIIKMEKIDFNFLTAIDTNESIEQFRRGIYIIKYNLN